MSFRACTDDVLSPVANIRETDYGKLSLISRRTTGVINAHRIQLTAALPGHHFVSRSSRLDAYLRGGVEERLQELAGVSLFTRAAELTQSQHTEQLQCSICVERTNT